MANKTTMAEWFQDSLCAKVRQQAMANALKFAKPEAPRPLGHEFDTASDALISAFPWNSTEEGYNYWAKIYLELKESETNNN